MTPITPQFLSYFVIKQVFLRKDFGPTVYFSYSSFCFCVRCSGMPENIFSGTFVQCHRIQKQKKPHRKKTFHISLHTSVWCITLNALHISLCRCQKYTLCVCFLGKSFQKSLLWSPGSSIYFLKDYLNLSSLLYSLCRDDFTRWKTH